MYIVKAALLGGTVFAPPIPEHLKPYARSYVYPQLG